MTLNLHLAGMAVEAPWLSAALEPAWSSLLQPALPELLNLNLKVSSWVPSKAWRSVTGFFVSPDDLPRDTTSLAALPSLSFDGTVYESDLMTAQLDGLLTYAPGAPLLAVGDLRLELTNLRALIGAMQRAARLPNRQLAQALTLGSIGLATLGSFAERGEGNTAILNVEFQPDGLPTVNGRPLPIGF